MHAEYNTVEAERTEHESDKIEREQLQEAEKWADEMEAAEQEAESAPSDPTQDPENIAWMQEQMEKAKALYGDDFGDDISENFDSPLGED